MKTATRIYLVRHGQVAGFEERRYNGHADVPLTELGMQQYQSLKERLATKKIAACISSDLTRCRTGADLICQQFGVQPEYHSGLRELNIGIWEGLTWQEIKTRWPEEWQHRLNDLVNYRVKDGENLLDLQARAMPIVQQAVKKYECKEILLVGHGGLNRIILLNAMSAPLTSAFCIEQHYGCLNIIDYYNDGLSTVMLLNG